MTQSNSVSNSLVVAIPAFNEEASIEAVIKQVKAAMPQATVVVVNDCSQDNTAIVAEKAGADVVLSLPINLGVGGAMRTAFKFAYENNYSRLIQIDGDGQHDAFEATKVVSLLDEVDVSIGARFAGVGIYEVRGPRKWAMIFLAKTLSLICGTKLTDTTSGLRGAGPKAIELFSKKYPAEYLGDTVESLVIAKRNGLSIGQTPVAMSERTGGTPSQSPIRAMLYLFRAMIAVMFSLMKKPEAE
jgi:glycosyltransferase involved in cell wall biosynthesis